MSHHAGRAFAVYWSEADRWNPGSFRDVAWNWPTDVIRPLSTALRRRIEVVDRSEHPLNSLTFGSLHFTGELSVRDMSSKHAVKGKLCFAHANDVVYSKIDARNGAIGIVPAALPRVVFSSEFPIYEVASSVALPDYVKLLFRMDSFRKRINSLISGASGRKRVEPSTLEGIEVPLPPLATQQAIVEYWKAARKIYAETIEGIKRGEASIIELIYDRLGIDQSAKSSRRSKFMPLKWSELERWSVGYLAKAASGLIGFTSGSFPIVPLAEHLVETTNGYCIRPVGYETRHRMLRLSALTPAGLDSTDTKFVDVPDAISRRFSLKAGDLLICRSVGSYDMIAKCAVVPNDEPNILFPDIIIRARMKPTLLPIFVRELMQTPIGRSHFQSNARTAVGMWKIGAGDIEAFRIPLPPLMLQEQLVAEVTAAREKIAAERAAAAKLAAETSREVEEMILGHRPAPNLT